MNQMFCSTRHQMNTIYINVNIGSQLGNNWVTTGPSHVIPHIISPNVRITTDPHPHNSPSLSSSSSDSMSSLATNSMTFMPMTSSGINRGQMIPKVFANNAMFDPIRYKTEMCKNFLELGQCKFGEKCYYAHFTHELKEATYKPKNYKTQLCKPFHREGFCDFGSRCAFIHTKPNVEQIVSKLQKFIHSVPPMPDITAEEDMIRNNGTEKRLKVFKNMSSK